MGTQGNDGGARRDRTADLLHAMQALSQLSYGPTKGGEFSVTGVGKSICIAGGPVRHAVQGLSRRKTPVLAGFGRDSSLGQG